MKKIGLGILIVGFVIAVAGVVIAQGPVNRQPAEVVLPGQEVEVPEQAIDSSPALVRVIAPTTSSWSKFGYGLMGCTVVHQLQDATALKCPAQIASLLNLREDRIFYITDLEADIQINADDVWAQGIDGTGVNVAVLDTGIDTNHPELSDSIVGCESFVEGTTCEDDHGHGTHVSGIITANGVDSMAKGVAPGAGIYMYKVCDASGSCYESDIMAAMEAAVLTDAKVMNISLGGGNFSGEDCDTDTLAAKTNWVVSNGITVAAAAGNDQFFVSSPACASGAIAVGAVDKNGLMAYFSNFGPSLDVVAPGVDIYSSIIDGYASWKGTSMSAPHVAGTVALVLDANPSLIVDEIKTALYETADPINPDSVCYGVVRQRGRVVWIGEVECTSDNSGAGIVDAYGAVNYYVPTPPVDNDGDGYTSDIDCNDNDSSINPGATEICNSVDDDCDGLIDEGFDVDGDGYTSCGGDCNDNDATINPGASETSCDGIDNDCDLLIDEDYASYICGVGACEASSVCESGVDSCTAGTPTEEVCGDGIDNDCNGETDEGCEPSAVCGDGYCAGAELGEDCKTCLQDCPSKTTKNFSWCCGDGICSGRGENADNCPVDCQ